MARCHHQHQNLGCKDLHCRRLNGHLVGGEFYHHCQVHLLEKLKENSLTRRWWMSPEIGRISFCINRYIETSCMNETVKIRIFKKQGLKGMFVSSTIVVSYRTAIRCDRRSVLVKLGFLSFTIFVGGRHFQSMVHDAPTPNGLLPCWFQLIIWSSRMSKNVRMPI